MCNRDEAITYLLGSGGSSARPTETKNDSIGTVAAAPGLLVAAYALRSFASFLIARLLPSASEMLVVVRHPNISRRRPDHCQ